MKKYIPILYLLIGILLIGSVNAEITLINSDEVIKDGITMKLISNSDFCGTECYSKYLVCDSGDRINDLNFKFLTLEKSEKEIIKYINYDIIEDKDGCRILEITGFKNKFESIDNIPCFNDICFYEFAWWNTSYPYRWRIFTTVKTPDMIFNVNDTGVPNYWTNNKSIMYKYCKNLNCNESIIIGNKTDQLNWENGTSGLGYNPELVYDSYFKGVYHVDGSDSIARDSTTNDEDGIIDIINYNGVWGNALQYTTNLHTGNITIPFNSSGAYTFNQNLTICAWFNFTDYDTTGGKPIIAKGNFGVWDTVEWVLIATGFQTPKGELDCNYKNPLSNSVYQKKVNQILTNNKIHHTCCIFDETGEIYIYLDGLLQTPTTISGTKTSTWDNESSPQQPITIGAEGRGGGGTTGFIDDVYIINDVMDSDWVSDLYNSGSNQGVTEFYNLSVVTFDVTDINIIDLTDFNIICNNNYSYIGASSPHIDNLTYGNYNCSFIKSGFITEELNFILDDSFHNFSIIMTEKEGFDIVFNFDMQNAYYTTKCFDNDILLLIWNKTSCVDHECNDAYDEQYLPCPYGCIADIGQYGDGCAFPEWLMYLIVGGLVIIMLIVLSIIVSLGDKRSGKR